MHDASATGKTFAVNRGSAEMTSCCKSAGTPDDDAADLVAEARSWMAGKGTPWVHQGRLKFVGVDCLGLLGMSALALGLPGTQEWRDARNITTMGPTPQPELAYGGCEHFLDRIAASEAGVGDVLVMAMRHRLPQHFAIISRVDPVYLVHAYTSVGRVTENGLAVAGARVLRAYRFRGLTA
jgi:cell wall-associated NlpC family hydrolase